MRRSIEHFVFHVPLKLTFYGMIYGTGVGAITGIIVIIHSAPNEELPTIFIWACIPVVVVAGAILGMILGGIIGIIDSLFIVFIALSYLPTEKVFYSTSILISLFINTLLVLACFGSGWIASGATVPLIILSILTAIATILGIRRFCHWHFNCNIYPDILYQMEIMDSSYIEGGYDRLTYEMPPLPTNLTH